VPLHACLIQKNGVRRGMEDDGKDAQGAKRISANDNGPERKVESGEEITPLQKLDRVVLDIARLIGRQMARDDFARLRTAASNDNEPGRANNEE